MTPLVNDICVVSRACSTGGVIAGTCSPRNRATKMADSACFAPGKFVCALWLEGRRPA